MGDALERNTESLEHLVEELKGVRDSVEELYILLDHVWRNREELFNALERLADARDVPESIACARCDADSPDSLAAAVQEGWTQLQRDDAAGWNFLGVCPACQQEELAEERDAASRKQANALLAADTLSEESGATPAGSILVDERQFDEALGALQPLVKEDGAEGEIMRVEAERFAEAMENVEQLVYCCDRPNLRWHGDPERPGIACASCGFPVASEGDIVCWREEEESGNANAKADDSPPPSPQKELF